MWSLIKMNDKSRGTSVNTARPDAQIVNILVSSHMLSMDFFTKRIAFDVHMFTHILCTYIKGDFNPK